MSERLLVKCVAVKLEQDTYRLLKVAAAAEGKSMAEFLRDRIEVAVRVHACPPLAPPRLEPWRAA